MNLKLMSNSKNSTATIPNFFGGALGYPMETDLTKHPIELKGAPQRFKLKYIHVHMDDGLIPSRKSNISINDG